MIFKVVRYTEGKGVSNTYGDTKGLVVPHNNWIFESPSAKYQKVRVETWKEFHRYLDKNFGSYQLIGNGPECGCGIDAECDKCSQRIGVSQGATPSQYDYWGLEFILLVLAHETHVKVVVITDGSLFIMSEEGKTVDSIHLPK